jgi:hypothetical protein
MRKSTLIMEDTMNRIMSIFVSIALFPCALLSQPLINQVQTDGATGFNNEFVELCNRTLSPISLAGYQLRYYNSLGVLSRACAFSTETQFSVPAGGFFLIGSSGYDYLGILADTICTGGYSKVGGQLGLFNGSGQLVDGLAWGSVTPNIVGEGSTASPAPTGACLIRTPDGFDTNDNSVDFKINSTPTPRNARDSQLPIQVATLAAFYDQSERSVLLKWVTVSETNNFGFEVERSSQSVGPYLSFPGCFVQGHGTTLVPHAYVFSDQMATSGNRWYRLKQIDLDGTIHYTEAVQVQVNKNTNDEALPAVFSLAQNYPNPFNPSTTITVALPRDAKVSLEIYNTLGQKVVQLVDEVTTAGYHSVVFDASRLASGLYLYRMKSGDFVATQKMLVVK